MEQWDRFVETINQIKENESNLLEDTEKLTKQILNFTISLDSQRMAVLLPLLDSLINLQQIKTLFQDYNSKELREDAQNLS